MKKVAKWMLAVVASIALLALVPAAPVQASEDQNLYCLYNPVSGEYLYTIDVKEKENLESSWIYEGVVCYMPVHSGSATYRLYDAASSKHLYTSDEAEISKLVGEGWIREGVAYFVDEAKKAPVYRFFNPTTGDHAFGGESVTADMEQKGWVTEGVAYYAMSVNNTFAYTTNDGSCFKGGNGAAVTSNNKTNGSAVSGNATATGAGYVSDPAIVALPINQVAASDRRDYSDNTYAIYEYNSMGYILGEYGFNDDGTLVSENHYLYYSETDYYRETYACDGQVYYDVVYGVDGILFSYSTSGGKDG